MAGKKHDPLAELDAKLAAKKEEQERHRQAGERSASEVRRLEKERRLLVQAQIGALADESGLAQYPLDVLGEVFLGVAALLAKYVETPARMRAQLEVLMGGKEGE